MLNWHCEQCVALNSPRKEACWQCGNGRSSLPTPAISKSPTLSPSPWQQIVNWPHWNQIPRLVGLLGGLLLGAGLLLPWVVRLAPESGPQLLLGYTLRYGQATLVVGLLLLYLLLRNGLSIGWYGLAFVLAFVPLILAPLPAQTMQVFDAVAANIGGAETAETVSFFGRGVPIVSWAALCLMSAAILHLVRASRQKRRRAVSIVQDEQMVAPQS